MAYSQFALAYPGRLLKSALGGNIVPSSRHIFVVVLPVGEVRVCAGGRLSTSCGQQPGQSCEIVCGHCQNEPRPNAFNTAIHGLCHATHGFNPANHLFRFLWMFLGQGVALMSGGHQSPNISFLGDVGPDAGFA